MSRSHRRKQLSLDGSISGVEFNRFRPGIKAFSTRSVAGPGHMHFEQYDPVRAAYDWDMPDYHPPEPLFEDIRHQAPQPERIGPGRPTPEFEHEETVRYRDAQMTPALFQHLMAGLSTAGPLANDEEPAQLEGMLPAAATASQESQLDASMWAPREMQGEHLWFGSEPGVPDASQVMMMQATEPSEPLVEIDVQDAAMQATCDQQPAQGLEALIRESMPFQSWEDPFELERKMHDQQMQQLEQMFNPFIMPGFGPGP